MFNKSDSYEIFCDKERTSLLSFLLAIAFIIGTICGLITNCINLKIFMHKRYPTTTLSIYQMVLCFVDMVALLIGGCCDHSQQPQVGSDMNMWQQTASIRQSSANVEWASASEETRQFLPGTLSDNRNHQKRIEIRQHSTVLAI
uniref:G-protein coupled receptors family 1 profile domain-containing protein n=1 Tax=Romanomermis culicivorax TaxID=13658 RepID=A0A915IZ33_ROMCU